MSCMVSVFVQKRNGARGNDLLWSFITPQSILHTRHFFKRIWGPSHNTSNSFGLLLSFMQIDYRSSTGQVPACCVLDTSSQYFTLVNGHGFASKHKSRDVVYNQNAAWLNNSKCEELDISSCLDQPCIRAFSSKLNRTVREHFYDLCCHRHQKSFGEGVAFDRQLIATITMTR